LIQRRARRDAGGPAWSRCGRDPSWPRARPGLRSIRRCPCDRIVAGAASRTRPKE